MAAFEDKYGRPLGVPRDVGASRRGRRVLHAARPEPALATSARWPRSGARSTGTSASCRRQPEHDLLQRRRLGEREQRGRRRAFGELLKSRGVARARLPRARTGSSSTASWAPATASPAARSPTRPRSSRATRTSTRRTSAQFIKTRRHAGPHRRRRADPPAGDLLQHLLRRERVLDPARHEAAYLFLQWAGGARVYTWLTANPAGYQDPHHIYTFNDPLSPRATSRSRWRCSARSCRARPRRSPSRAAVRTATR